MNEIKVMTPVFSPRWGHPDPYTVTLSTSGVHVSNGNFEAIASPLEGGDFEWDGYGRSTGNPLMSIFSNDSIQAPEIVPWALEQAWLAWNEERVEAQVIEDGIRELFEWVSLVATNKPRGKLWVGVF